MKLTTKFQTAMTLALVAVTTTATAKAPGISVSLEPEQILVGQAALLTVTILGQNAAEPEIPPVSGLSFEPNGQSSQIQIINGAMSANISHTFAVVPSHEGTFTIPKIRVGSGADAAESQPLVMKVSKGHVAGSPNAGQNSPAQNSLPSSSVNDEEGDVTAPDKNSLGFLRIISPKKEFYVGEMVPVELKAYFRDGVELRVDGLPRMNSDAFTMNKLGDKPAASRQLIGGVPYSVLTWATAITAVKAGDYQLSVEIPTTVTVRQRATRPRSRGGNPFGDPFFDDVFNDPFFNNFLGAATQKQVVLGGQPDSVKILPLPTENRPESFSGAVGKFNFTAEATPTRTATGDPVTLKFKVTGSGNFDRVAAPVLEKSEAWKTYKASAKFVPEDSAGYSGEKTFEQALVPTAAGSLDIPSPAFSYFDPEKKEYVTRNAAPLRVEVAPAQLAPAHTVATVTPQHAVATPESKADKPVASRSNAKVQLKPLQVGLGVVAGLILIGLFVAFRLIHRRRRARDLTLVHLASAQRAVEAQLDAMESAVQRGSAPEFFAAARGAFQILLGLRWRLPPQTITLAEINARMNGEADGLRSVFDLADEVSYTGRAFAPAELKRLQAVVNAELKKLEAI